MYFINPSNFKEFNDFLKDKKVFVISNFGTYLHSVRLNFFFLKKN